MSSFSPQACFVSAFNVLIRAFASLRPNFPNYIHLFYDLMRLVHVVTHLRRRVRI